MKIFHRGKIDAEFQRMGIGVGRKIYAQLPVDQKLRTGVKFAFSATPHLATGVAAAKHGGDAFRRARSQICKLHNAFPYFFIFFFNASI